MAPIGPFARPGTEAVGSSPFILRGLRMEMGFSERN